VLRFYPPSDAGVAIFCYICTFLDVQIWIHIFYLFKADCFG